MNRQILPLLIVLSLVCAAAAQQQHITGTVTAATGEPLPGTTILVKDTQTGTVADSDGTYTLAVPSGAKTLVFKFLGYETLELPIDGKPVIDVTMTESANRLNEVVVAGFGNFRKRQITSAISSVDTKVFNNVSTSNFQRALQGRMPGVVITNSSGGLNAEAIIRIRGTGSISAGNQPLFVVDGLILTAKPGDVLGYTTNPLIALNPNDIASVEVLKDAAAAAIYGSRGSNGVILITTKSGNFNSEPKVELGWYAGFSEISKKRDLLTGPEYAALWNVAATNASETDPAVFYENPAAEPSTDWQGLLLRRGFVQEANASVSGGTADTRYYIGSSVRDEDSYLRTIGLKRYSVRANFEQKIGKKWKAGLSVNPSRVEDNRTGNQWGGAAWGATSWYHPNVEALDENGECRRDALVTSNGQTGNSTGNPCSVLEDQWIEATRSQVLLNAGLGWSPVPGLEFTTEWGTEYNQETQHLKFASTSWSGQPAGWAWTYRQEAFSYNWTTLANWRHSFGQGHELAATAGLQLTRENHDYLTVDGSGFDDDRLRFVGSAATIEYVNTQRSEAAFAGYLARLNYSFKNKYLLTLAGRYDGSSRFGTNNRWGFFPALSAGWIISEESFFRLPAVDFLKIRTAIGLTGNAGIGDFAARGLVYTGANYSGQPGFAIESVENNLLGWEKNRQWDAGLEFSLWNGRVNGSVEYFIKTTKDLLLEKPVPATNGTSTLTSNTGEVRNRGLEFDLFFGILKGKFKWSLRLNGATLKNEVLHLADQDGDGTEDDIIQYGRMLFRPGESIGTFFMVEYAGVDPANGDALFYDTGGNKVPNDASDAYRKIAGNSIPAFTGGFAHTFEFMNFDLSTFFQFKTGYRIYMQDKNMEHNGTWGNNQHRSQLDYWASSNTDTNVPQPRLYQTNGLQHSTRYLDEGGFLRLQHLELGYTLPLQSKGASRLRIFAAAQNLLTLTKFRGLDPDSEFLSPEGAALGMVNYNLPAARTFTFGCNASF